MNWFATIYVYLLRIYAASVFSFYYYSSYLYTYCILYVSTMTCLLYTFLRFTRRPPSLEIIFDRIRDESRSGTTCVRRIGSEFQLVFTCSVSVFKNGLVCWQCRSYFCFLLVVHAVASHVLLYKTCLKMCVHGVFFSLSVYEYLLRSEFLYLSHMTKIIVFNNPFLIRFLYHLMEIISIQF